jgi:thiol-disulfide isomerase/thioredoxin
MRKRTFLAALAASLASGTQAASPAPALSGAVEWINSTPLSLEALRGKVVLVDFWTYSCINCLRTLPYVKAWAAKYREAGLVVVGVHTPEFEFEKLPAHVRRATRDLGIDYPVAIDSNFTIWNAWRNRAWPALYLVDGQGRLRHQQYGEGRYEELEQLIQALLRESGARAVPGGVAVPAGEGVQAAGGSARVLTPETYVGYGQAEGAASALLPDRAQTYVPPQKLAFNQWALDGSWRVERDRAMALSAGTRVRYRFGARDLHMVLGPGEGPVRFRVLLDGQPPGADHGTDTDAQGLGSVDRLKLYQLLRISGAGRDHVFEIEFLTPGAQAFAFTFG